MTQFDETYFIVILKTRFLFYYSERESERFCMNLEFYTSFCFKKKFQTFFIFLLFHWILSHKEISEIERRKKNHCQLTVEASTWEWDMKVCSFLFSFMFKQRNLVTPLSYVHQTLKSIQDKWICTGKRFLLNFFFLISIMFQFYKDRIYVYVLAAINVASCIPPL